MNSYLETMTGALTGHVRATIYDHKMLGGLVELEARDCDNLAAARTWARGRLDELDAARICYSDLLRVCDADGHIIGYTAAEVHP